MFSSRVCYNIIVCNYAGHVQIECVLYAHVLQSGIQQREYAHSFNCLHIFNVYTHFWSSSFLKQPQHRNATHSDDWNMQLITFVVDGIFVLVFAVALIFHGHQTEATYRLDFIWKLQATGMDMRICTECKMQYNGHAFLA